MERPTSNYGPSKADQKPDIYIYIIYIYRGTEEIIDIMFKVGLQPVISKPTRITQTTNSLIDNIFTNCINDEIYSGLLINDLSDHLPIFIMSKKA